MHTRRPTLVVLALALFMATGWGAFGTCTIIFHNNGPCCLGYDGQCPGVGWYVGGAYVVPFSSANTNSNCGDGVTLVTTAANYSHLWVANPCQAGSVYYQGPDINTVDGQTYNVTWSGELSHGSSWVCTSGGAPAHTNEFCAKVFNTSGVAAYYRAYVNGSWLGAGSGEAYLGPGQYWQVCYVTTNGSANVTISRATPVLGGANSSATDYSSDTNLAFTPIVSDTNYHTGITGATDASGNDNGYPFQSLTNNWTTNNSPVGYYDKTNGWQNGLALDSSVKQGDAAVYSAVKELSGLVDLHGVRTEGKLGVISTVASAMDTKLGSIQAIMTEADGRLATYGTQAHSDSQAEVALLQSLTNGAGNSTAQLSAAVGIYSISNSAKASLSDLDGIFLNVSNLSGYALETKNQETAINQNHGITLTNMLADLGGIKTYAGNIQANTTDLINGQNTSNTREQEISNNTLNSLSAISNLNLTVTATLATNGVLTTAVVDALTRLQAAEKTNIDGVVMMGALNLSALTNAMNDLQNKISQGQVQDRTATNLLGQIAANTASNAVNVAVTNSVQVSNYFALSNNVTVTNAGWAPDTNAISSWGIPSWASNWDGAVSWVRSQMGSVLADLSSSSNGVIAAITPTAPTLTEPDMTLDLGSAGGLSAMGFGTIDLNPVHKYPWIFTFARGLLKWILTVGFIFKVLQLLQRTWAGIIQVPGSKIQPLGTPFDSLGNVTGIVMWVGIIVSLIAGLVIVLAILILPGFVAVYICGPSLDFLSGAAGGAGAMGGAVSGGFWLLYQAVPVECVFAYAIAYLVYYFLCLGIQFVAGLVLRALPV